jgi:glycosyltransferase involved in cell wall biosynthesis
MGDDKKIFNHSAANDRAKPLMDTPKVSVLIPSYNQEDVIEQTLLSALTQDYDNLEVVVTDDASQDRTPQIIKEIALKYPGRLTGLLHQDNLGVTRNHTRGLLKCTGDFVAFQDGDDLFLPGKINKQVLFLSEHDNCTICFHDVDVFDSDTDETLYLWSERFGHREGGIKALVRYGNYLPSVSVMVRRKHLPAYGYDDRIRIGSDWLLWLETLACGGGNICYLDEVLARYRRHSDNLTNSWQWKFEDQLITLALTVTRWPELAFSARIRQSEIYFTQAVQLLTRGQYGKAANYFASSVALGLPLPFPAFRLVWREFVFSRRRKLKNDDLRGISLWQR